MICCRGRALELIQVTSAPVGYDVVYCLVPRSRFSLELAARKQASSKMELFAKAFQREEISDLSLSDTMQ